MEGEMTNFLSYFSDYLSKGYLGGDEDLKMPEPRYIDMPRSNVSTTLEEVLTGKYTVTEEIKTYNGFEYTAAIQPIGKSPKWLKKQIRLALKEEGIPATVSVKPGRNELNLKIKVREKELERIGG